MFFQGISLVLLIGSSSAFSFYLIFSVSKNLGETVIYCGLESVFLCGNVPVQTVYIQCFRCKGWFWYAHQPRHSSGCAVRKPLDRGVVSVVLSRAWAGCEVGPPLCSVAVTALSGAGALLPSCWSRSSEG